MLPLVHRFWWHPQGRPMSPTAMQSLLCVSPLQQRLWTYDRVALASLPHQVPGLQLCDAAVLLDPALASALVSAGMHICLLKDCIAALIIYHAGGLFLDLDYIWLGRSLPMVDGLAFGSEPLKTEPPQRRPKRSFVVAEQLVRLNVGLLAGEAGSECFRYWAKTLYAAWHTRLSKWMSGHASLAMDRADPEWLSNTHHLHDYIVRNSLQSSILPAHLVSPWPMWMSRFIPAGDSCCGYTVPRIRLLREEGIFCNIWESQWLASEAGELVRAHAAQLRKGNKLSPLPNLSLRRKDDVWHGRLTGPSQGPREFRPARIDAMQVEHEIMKELWEAVAGADDRVCGWTTTRFFRCSKADANIFAALSTVSIKQCAPHLYKAARDRIATDFYMWGPLPTLVLVGEQWQRRCALAANTTTTAIWVILSGILEFTLPDKTPKAFAAGSVVVSDLLLRGGHVARLTDDTRVLWGCAPKWRSLQKNSRLREQMRKSRASKKLIGRLRLSASRARSHRWDVRRRTMPPCEHCVLSVL